ncbi:DUF3060 domain-containing protein [Microbacterium thalli]|uniref:DUF3060 domain-containing protein n=1 Tax=Microbacterium thalli TaxID=3027921 RepID=A0ABT5SIR8_9MICO|nr:DUF3060 domain-containing protein [Microbacterium thalli]MDD7929777.1 DUF3060 domain-containing protein [Microbacterium thalli]MDD7962722.1 DUF3060 domain-containing protein [Microbacterium thalli]MDN8547627.1 DUF3060 domain-containing protein [Microbacterium thalli]
MRRALVWFGAVGVVFALTACVPADDAPDRVVRPSAPSDASATAPAPVSPQPATPSSSPSTGGSDLSMCIAGVVALRGSDIDLSFTGECDRVEIEGAGLDVDLSDARVTTVVVRGDRVEVDLADVNTLEITGQAADIDADVIGSLSVAGDRNAIDGDEISAVSVAGNDNRVHADRLGSVEQAGDRNDIRPD